MANSSPRKVNGFEEDLRQVTGKNCIFPLEVFECIADSLIHFLPAQAHNGGPIHSSKPPFTDVCGFMSASMRLHCIGMARWVRMLTIRAPEDWETALKRSYLVRELICHGGACNSWAVRSVLAQFPNLHTISINVHNDVYRNHSGRFSYRDVFDSLPTGLLRLEVSHAHGPDLKIIETVRRCCPNIETLRLGRCTMFNRTPACEFWTGFPFDHDAYIASDGTDDYAHSVAQELTALKRLKNLRLGVYLIPSTTVLAHRAYHTRKQPGPVQIHWQQALIDLGNSNTEPDRPPDVSRLISLYHQIPEVDFGPDSCTFCREAFLAQSKHAEQSASVVMKETIPSLQTVEWMDWFSPSHLGTTCYSVGSLSKASTG